MKDFIDQFLLESNYADSTETSYRYALYRLADWLVENKLEFDQLTLRDYDRFLNGHGWSSNMKRLYAASIRAFLLWAGYDRKTHPFFKRKLPKDDSAPGRALNQVQLRDLLASFDTTKPIGWRDLAMCALFADTGLRASEMCKIELGKLNMEERTVWAFVKRGRWQEKKFSEDTARFLAIWLDLRKNYAANEGIKTVFVSVSGLTKGQPLTKDGLRALYRKFGKRSGVGPLSPHDMRRTMAVLLTEAGAPTRMVQLLGGWEDIRMVERYTRSIRSARVEKYSPVSALFGGGFSEAIPVDS